MTALAYITLSVDGVRFRAVAKFDGASRDMVAAQPTAHGALRVLADQFEALGKGGDGDAQRLARVQAALAGVSPQNAGIQVIRTAVEKARDVLWPGGEL